MIKNLQRFLVVSATMATCVGAYAIDKVVKETKLTGEITSVEALQETKFLLQNEEGNMLHTHGAGNYWDCYVSSLTSTIENTNDRGFKFGLETVEGVEGFIMPVFKNDGTNYTFWAGAGYVNAQPGGNVIFALAGKDGQHGQDGANLAVWNVTYTEGSGFAFANVGRAIYLGAEENAARPSEEIKYWKAYTDYSAEWNAATVNSVADEVLAAIKTSDAKTAIEEAKAGEDIDALAKAVNAAIDVINECDAINASFSAIEDEAIKGLLAEVASKYEAGEYNNAAALRTAYANAVKAQKADGANMTLAIINPSFETGTIEGWTSTNGGAIANNMNFGENIAGQKFVERWTQAPGTLSDGSLLQTLTDMPNGTYKLTANMQNLEQKNDPATNGSGFFLVLNDAQTDCTAPGKVEVEGTVTDGTMTIGVKLEGCTGNWMCIDNFELTLVKAEVAEEPETPAQLVADGTYYIYNTEAQAYLSNGAAWGTRSVLADQGIAYGVSCNVENGKYTLKSGIKDDAKALRPSDGFNDQSGEWEIKETEGGFALFNGEKYFSHVEGSMVPGYTDDITAGSVWTFVTAESRKALLSDATAENPVDATVYIKAPDFLNSDVANAAWEGNKVGGNNASGNTLINNTNCEKWNAGSFTVSQTITDIPNGIYKLTAQAYYRHGGTGAKVDENGEVTTPSAADVFEAGEEVLPTLFANDNKVTIKSIFSEAKEAAEGGWAVASGAYFIPNSQAQAAACFETGAYINTIENIEVTDNTLTIGVTREGEQVEDWTVFDTFRLTYYGEKTETPEEPEGWTCPEGETDITTLDWVQLSQDCIKDFGEDKGNVFGTDAGGSNISYVDITNYESIKIYGAEGSVVRAFINREEADAAGQQFIFVFDAIGADGVATFNLSKVLEVQPEADHLYLNGIKAGPSWDSKATVYGITLTGKTPEQPEIAGTTLILSPGGNSNLPVPEDAVRVFSFTNQWSSTSPTVNSFGAAIYKDVKVEFEEALEYYFNTPYKDATGEQKWGGVAVGATEFSLDLTTIGSITEFNIQNVTADATTGFAIKSATATKLDGTVENLVFQAPGWGGSMNVDATITSAVATFNGQWANIGIKGIEGVEGKKLIRFYANSPINVDAIQYCVKTADGADAWPQLTLVNDTYAETVIDETLSSLLLQWRIEQAGSVDIAAITYEILPSEEPAVKPEFVYVIGDINDREWDPSSDEIKLVYNEEADNYTGTIEVRNKWEGFGWVGFSTALSEDKDNWDAFNAARISVTADWGTIGEAGTIVIGQDASFKLAEGSYNVTISLANSTILIESNVVDGIASVDAAAKANGKYIENGKVVIVKNGVKYNVAGARIK